MRKRGITLDESILKAIRETRRDLSQARHLPGFLYTAPEVFDYEVDAIFMKEWLCIGRVEEFENEGDYRAMRIAGEPLLVCRDASGQLNAFNNVCQHRGVEVATGEGNRKSFRCPYHSWVYDLEGRLLGAPHTKEVEGLRLRRLRAAAGQPRHLGRLHLRQLRPRVPEPRRLPGRGRDQAVRGLPAAREHADLGHLRLRGAVQLEVHPREPDGHVPRGRDPQGLLRRALPGQRLPLQP